MILQSRLSPGDISSSRTVGTSRLGYKQGAGYWLLKPEAVQRATKAEKFNHWSQSCLYSSGYHYDDCRRLLWSSCQDHAQIKWSRSWYYSFHSSCLPLLRRILAPWYIREDHCKGRALRYRIWVPRGSWGNHPFPYHPEISSKGRMAVSSPSSKYR